jgi:uncharacterized protein DUF4277
MALTVERLYPVAHLPLGLGVLRRLDVAAIIDRTIPPPPAPILSWGRGVEALVLALLDGHHARYQVGARLEERGRLPWLQDGLGRASLTDDRLGQILEARFRVESTDVRPVAGRGDGLGALGATPLCRAPRTGSVGTAATRLAPRGGKTRAYPG